jgi:hypothetical protein
MRETSIEAFKVIQSSGLVNDSQQKVWKFMREAGKGFTGTELDRAMAHEGEANASYHKRLSELETLGLVVGAEQRECSVTGMMCVEWFAIDAAPKEVKKAVRGGKKAFEAERAEWKREREELIEQNETLIMMNEKLREQVNDLKGQLVCSSLAGI